MRFIKPKPGILIFAALLVLCCSSNNGPLTSPGVPGEYPPWNGGNARVALGVYKIAFDESGELISMGVMRDVLAHYDITGILLSSEYGDCLVTKLLDHNQPAKHVKMKVSVRNRTDFAYSDVRGILVNNDPGIVLTNADGYTPSWDDGGAIIINAFKAFATNKTMRRILPYEVYSFAHFRYYEIDYSTLKSLMDTVLVLDASWPDNCIEPYAVEEFVQDQAIPPEGGASQVSLKVLDWQDDACEVFIDMSGLGGDIAELSPGEEENTWTGMITTTAHHPPGKYRVLAYAGTEGSTLRMYNYFDATVGQVECEPDYNNGPTDADVVECGESSGPNIVCFNDKQDWFKFTCVQKMIGDVVVDVISDTGMVDIAVYADPYGSQLKWTIADFEHDGVISSGPEGVGPGAFFLCVLHYQDDELNRHFIVHNNLHAPYCEVDSNDGYSSAVKLNKSSIIGPGQVCIDDVEDWFRIYFDDTPGGSLIAKATELGSGPMDITMFTSNQAQNPGGPNLASEQFGAKAEISLDDMTLPPGDYYIRVRHIGNDAEIGKYTLEHDIGWSRTWGGGEQDNGYSVALDRFNQVYVTGSFEKHVDFDPGPGTDYHHASWDTDIFVSKFSDTGKHMWTRAWGGAGTDIGRDIATGASSDIFITGTFENGCDFDPGPDVDVHNSRGDYDAFLTKLDADGNYNWTRTWGDLDVQYGEGVRADRLDNIFVTGYFRYACDFHSSPAGDKVFSKGKYDAYLCKFDWAGKSEWAKTWGGPDSDYSRAVDIGRNGNPVVGGSFRGLVDFDPGDAEDAHESFGSDECYISQFLADGTHSWTRTWGGFSGDEVHAVVCGSNNEILAAGDFDGVVDFDPGPGVVELDSHNRVHGFLCRYTADGDFGWARNWGGTSSSTTVVARELAPDNLGNIYVTGYYNGQIDFDPGPGEDWHSTLGSYENVFLCKYSAPGAYIWGVTLGEDSAAQSAAWGVASTGVGDVYITGYFKNEMDFAPYPKHEYLLSFGGQDVFLCMFTPDGKW